ncbi:MAG: helix-turn-helix transcriptional regulator [Eubacteriales bacterium]
MRIRTNVHNSNIKQGDKMQIKQAIVSKFKNLCDERGIALNQLATLSGVTPSTVYSMVDDSRKDLSVITVKKLCDGLEISIDQFFDDDIFRNLDQEIF